MPIHDTIYQRLRGATEAELDAFARALREERTYDRDVDVTELSRKYRADAGNWFKNIPRKKDELLYRAILDDVVEAVAESAAWRAPSYSESVGEEPLEEYIVRAAAFGLDRATKKPTPQASKLACETAEAMLNGGAAPTPSTADALRSAISSPALALAVGGSALLLKAINWLADPKLRTVVPATFALIHVRKRIAAEASLADLGGPS